MEEAEQSLADITVDVRDYGNFVSGTDITDTLKLAVASINTSGKRLVIPRGTYTISDTIQVNRMASIVCSGLVKFMYGISDTSKPMFQFNATSNIDTEHMYDFGVWFDGGSGGVILKNTGSAGIAIKIGTDSNTGFNNRLQKFKNIGICGFNLGVQFTTYNNYIMSFENCVWAYNNIHVCFGVDGTIGTVTNSGENLEYNNCVFSQAYKSVVKWNTNGFDCNFYGCSFDFNECIFHQLDGTAGGKNVNVYGGHIEGVTNFTGDNASTDPYGVTWGTAQTTYLMTEFRNNFNFDGTVFMLKNTKKIFNGNCAVGLTNVKIKLAGTIQNTKLASVFSLSDGNGKITYRNIDFPNSRYGVKMPGLTQNILPFSEFEDLTVQTGLSTVTTINKAYKLNFKRNTDDAVDVIASGAFGGKYVKFEFHDYGVTNTYLTVNIDTVNGVKCSPGRELMAVPVINLDTLPTQYTMSMIFSFYNGTDLISATTAYYRYATSIPGSTSIIGLVSGDINQWITPINQITKVIAPQGCDNVKLTFNNEIQGLTTDVSNWYFGGIKIFEL